MTISRRMIVLGASAAVAVPRGRAFADDYPSRPVKIIVPFGAGGPTDLYTRAMAEELRKNLHQSFVMENRPGAGSVIGTDVVAKSAPDGYTLLMISATQTVNETLIINKTYHLMRDFVMIAPLIKSDLVLVVHPSVPAKTVQELIALAKAKPGTLNYASSGIGSNYHMAGELFKHLTGTNIVHVPYKGSTGARTDILSGQVQMMFDSVPSMAPMIKGKLVRALATSGLKRSQVMPDVPTLDESGVRGYEASLWTGFVAPARTPEPIVKLLSTEIDKVLARPDVRESWEMQGAIPMSMTPDQFTAFVQSEIVKWAGVIKANGIKPIN